MQFRAVMTDQGHMMGFLNLTLMISKLAKKCVMDITPQKNYLIASEEMGNGTPLVWGELTTNTIFTEYKMMETEDSPHLTILFNPLNLARAIAILRSGVKCSKLQLEISQSLSLSVEMDIATNNPNRYRRIAHDVPVVILSDGDENILLPFQAPTTDICLTFSSNRTIRNHIDKLKNLSPLIKFYASQCGELSITAETESSVVTSRYKNLEIKSTKSKAKEASCTVDCKKVAVLFSSIQMLTSEWSCGIRNDALIHIEINIQNGMAVHSIIPAVGA